MQTEDEQDNSQWCDQFDGNNNSAEEAPNHT